MLPLSFVESFLKKMKIKTILVVILSIFCFVAGFISSPIANPSYDYDENIIIDNNEQTDSSPEKETEASKESSSIDDVITHTTINSNEPVEPDVTINNNEPVEPSVTTSVVTEPIEKESDTYIDTKPNTPTFEETKIEMVWVTSSGKKYHSRPGCSNMKSPTQISIDEAKSRGYTACSKCH